MAQFVEYTEATWRNLNMRKLKVDESYLILNSFYDKHSYFYILSDECYKCPYTSFSTLKPYLRNEDLNNNETTENKLNSYRINVAHGQHFKIFDHNIGQYAFNNETSICQFIDNNMQEFGVYNITVHSNGTCTFVEDKLGVNINVSLLSVFLLVTLILAVIKVAWCAWCSFNYDEEAEIAPEMKPANRQRQRMLCIDAFRGLAIVLMIFVNSGGGEYWWIEHAPWNGLHLADIVFPSFLWIMGACIPISVASQLNRGTSKFIICRRILWRSIKLFIIGLCLNSINGPNLEKLRIMGVLQRFGIAYLVCGIVHTMFREPVIVQSQSYGKQILKDVISFKAELITAFALIAVYFGITFGLNVQECPKGYLGPGGKHNYGQYFNCTGGATGYIDLKILGNDHIYQHPTAKYIYDAKAFDPEGIFGCLLTIVQVFFGVFAGLNILVYTNANSRLCRWLVLSLVLGFIGGLFCMFSKENGLIPINKNLWSLSFVLITTSIAFAIFSFLYWIIDIQHWWSGFPFVECGKNAIIMYVGHTIMHKMLPWHWRIGEMNTHFILLLESVWNTILWIGIALYLDYKEFYYNV